MKIKNLIILLLLCSCAHQKDMSPEDLPSCDEFISEHLKNYEYEKIIQSLPSGGKYLDKYCSIAKKTKVSEPELAEKLQEIVEYSRQCFYSLKEPVEFFCNSSGHDNGDTVCKKDEDKNDEEANVRDDSDSSSQENILSELKTSKENCDTKSKLNKKLKDLKNLIGLDFPFVTMENEKIANEQIEHYQAEVDKKSALANQEKLKLEEAEKLEKQKNDEYYNSEGFYYTRLCSLIQVKKTYEAKIAQEKKAAKISGVVDQSALYKYGHGIAGINDMLPEHNKNYKLKYKKNLDMNKCICDYKSSNLGLVTCKVK